MHAKPQFSKSISPEGKRCWNKKCERMQGVQYVLSMMRKCIMVKVWESKNTKKNENGGENL